MSKFVFDSTHDLRWKRPALTAKNCLAISLEHFINKVVIFHAAEKDLHAALCVVDALLSSNDKNSDYANTRQTLILHLYIRFMLYRLFDLGRIRSVRAPDTEISKVFKLHVQHK